jgi:outer membrane lipoprotein
MTERVRRPIRMGHAAVLLACLALAACATTPPLDPAGTLADFGPHQVDATDPPAGSAVLWGGMIVEVDNRADRTEIEVLAYPLDARQRPRLEQPSLGRFIAVMPGFVDPLAWPQGRFVSLRGELQDAGDAGETHGGHSPRVAVQAIHLWPRGFRNDGPKIGIGVGVGISR